MALFRLVPVAVLSLLAGCGAVLHGSRQDVMVQSSPVGLKIDASPMIGTFTTPANLSLDRKNNYVLTFSSPGYNPTSVNVTNSIGVGTVVADVLLTGLVGVVVDGLTGSWYGLNPESVNVTLVKSGAGPGPDSIHIEMSQGKAAAGLEVKSDAPGVTVRVLRK
jgi:hypothetical protein